MFLLAFLSRKVFFISSIRLTLSCPDCGSPFITVLNFCHNLLRMFDSEAYSKTLGFQANPTTSSRQRLIYISCGMSRGQDDGIRLDQREIMASLTDAK